MHREWGGCQGRVPILFKTTTTSDVGDAMPGAETEGVGGSGGGEGGGCVSSEMAQSQSNAHLLSSGAHTESLSSRTTVRVPNPFGRRASANRFSILQAECRFECKYRSQRKTNRVLYGRRSKQQQRPMPQPRPRDRCFPTVGTHRWPKGPPTFTRSSRANVASSLPRGFLNR